MKTFITFGQSHVHRIDGVTYDADCIAVIEGPSRSANRERAFELFGAKFCFEYPEEIFDRGIIKYFSRGFIPVGDQ